MPKEPGEKQPDFMTMDEIMDKESKQESGKTTIENCRTH